MLDLHLHFSNESVLAPATSSVPLATTELRIGRRAEILFSCWQLVFDAPVAKFYTLLLSFSFLIATLHIITFLLILSLVYFSQLRVKSNFPNTQAGRNTVWEFILSFGCISHSPNGVASCDPLLLVWALGAGYEAWVAFSAPVIVVIAWIYDSMELSSSLAKLNASATFNITVN